MSKPNPRLRSFIDALYEAAGKTDLAVMPPPATNNYVRFKTFAAKSHVGVSVTKDRVRVTLNNDADKDGSVFAQLLGIRDEIDRQIGERLDWSDLKANRAKSVVRASRVGGYESDRATWPKQHEWALGIVKAFEHEFASKL